MRLEHPIFQGPLRAEIVLVESDWEQRHDDRGVWVVQTGELVKDVDYGVVSDGHGFEDSPDCERISGGVNSKGPYAVAIGRQANMLQWGFYAAPDRMTESAQQVFLNALVYMTRFDGHRPLVEKEARGRSWLQQYVEVLAHLDDFEPEMQELYRDFLSEGFPDGWVAECGLDPAALSQKLAENIEFLAGGEGHGEFVVDATLRELGVSNRMPAFLELLEERLGEDAADEVALELAARYLGEHGQSAERALTWIRANRQHLFFSDVGGFRWHVDVNAEGGL